MCSALDSSPAEFEDLLFKGFDSLSCSEESLNTWIGDGSY